ncbi:hypothetical protein C8J56DRAFT_975843 [Mycena floridula]|nr:hypothetical protein C8J56DRAFT_975843 [Mycena floridula]
MFSHSDCCPRSRTQRSSLSRSFELSRLLRNNILPESPTASQLLSEAEGDLTRCVTEIEYQQSYLVSLKAEQKMLEHHVRRCKSLLSPIRRIPTRILAHIFNLVCGLNHVATTGRRLPGIALGRVCSLWRRTALSTPEIWATISFQALNQPDQVYDSCWETVLANLLDRSYPHPLDISLHCGSQGIDATESITALENLSRSSVRWKSFQLKISISAQLDVVRPLATALDRLRHRLPLLQFVKLVNVVSDPLTMLEDVPILSSVTLGESETNCQTLTTDLSRITTLRIADISFPRNPLKFVSLFPHLASLSVRHPWLNCEAPNEPVISSSNLKKLHIVCDESFHDLDFLGHLSLPLLTILSLQCSTTSTASARFPIASVTSFISRSACSLTSLIWTNVPICYLDWIILLLAIPSLQALTVSNVETKLGDPLICDAFFQRLESHISRLAPVLLPKLEHLDVEAVAISLDIVAQAIQCRWTTEDDTACLKSVRLCLVEQAGDVTLPLHYMQAGKTIVVRDPIGVIYC